MHEDETMTEEKQFSEEIRMIKETIFPALKAYEGKPFIMLSALETAQGEEVSDYSSDVCAVAGRPYTRERTKTEYFYHFGFGCQSGVVGTIDGNALNQPERQLLPCQEAFNWNPLLHKFKYWPVDEELKQKKANEYPSWLNLRFHRQFISKQESGIILYNNGMLMRYKSPDALEKRKGEYDGEISLGDDGRFSNEMTAFIFGEEAIIKVLGLEDYLAYCTKSGHEKPIPNSTDSKSTGIRNTADLFQALSAQAVYKQVTELIGIDDKMHPMWWDAAIKNASRLVEKWKISSNKEPNLDIIEKEAIQRISADLNQKIDEYFRSKEKQEFGIARTDYYLMKPLFWDGAKDKD